MIIYQKILLAEDNETKIEYLFLLEELFQKANLSEIYSKFLSDEIKEIGIKNIPDKYKEEASARIFSDNVIGLLKSFLALSILTDISEYTRLITLISKAILIFFQK